MSDAAEAGAEDGAELAPLQPENIPKLNARARNTASDRVCFIMILPPLFKQIGNLPFDDSIVLSPGSLVYLQILCSVCKISKIKCAF